MLLGIQGTMQRLHCTTPPHPSPPSLPTPPGHNAAIALHYPPCEEKGEEEEDEVEEEDLQDDDEDEERGSVRKEEEEEEDYSPEGLSQGRARQRIVRLCRRRVPFHRQRQPSRGNRRGRGQSCPSQQSCRMRNHAP